MGQAVTRRKISWRRIAALGIPVALVATGTVLAAAPAAGAEGRGTDRCRLVQLAEPRWGHDGGVMDIENERSTHLFHALSGWDRVGVAYGISRLVALDQVSAAVPATPTNTSA